MFKETMICIVIVVVIFSLDMFTQKYTESSANNISNMFSDLKFEIIKQDKNKIDEQIKNIDKRWGEMHKKLAYYIEHDELEKVDTAIVKMKSYIEMDEYPSAVAELDEGKFVMDHIKDKYLFSLQNIF